MRAPTISFKRARGMRRQMTLPEVVLWDCLRKGRLKALRFRRQHPAGPYILDFYCPATRLAVEVDGEGHGHPDQARHDAVRDAWLGAQGIRVFRVTARAVLDDEELIGVLAEIEEAARAGSPPAYGGSTGDREAEARSGQPGEGGVPPHASALSLAPSTASRSPSPVNGGGSALPPLGGVRPKAGRGASA